MFRVRRAVPEDAQAIRSIAESLRFRPPGSDRGFLVHVRTEEGYCRALEISEHSHVAEEDRKVIGFLLVHTVPELAKLRKNGLATDVVSGYVLGLGEQAAVLADQIAVGLSFQSRGIGQALAEAMARDIPAAHFLAAIMHEPARNRASLRLALRNGWKLRTELPEGGFVWGIYGLPN